MADEPADRVTETDAHNLLDKLRVFEATLSPAEQTLFRSVLQRVAGVEDDAHGHLLLDAFISQVTPASTQDVMSNLPRLR